MSDTLNKSLPAFDKPPVIEVVCGLQFVPIRTFTLPHLGILWEKFKNDYPNGRDAIPLMPTIERFDDKGTDFNFPFVDELPPPRVWFESKDGNRLIQVQRDRFFYNWKKERDTDIYPHYDNIISNFRTCLATFEAFLEENHFDRIDPVQYELTYINHIFTGEGWKALDEIGNIFPDFHWRKTENRFLPSPETINWQTSFVLPERTGRLRVSIRLGKRKSDGLPTILLELTARGISADRTRPSMLSWFDMAHEWIVCGFTDLTAENMHRNFWRRTR